ncbi:MAG: hypothetical protein ACR5LG_14795 [Sodalis sp. (in: enterobacteria)]|uniref:hypothetical protein n=1 Tax=Sodalis sp. (in: enterobacteria) TaxID=1898979 RepID=UPI003F3C9621
MFSAGDIDALPDDALYSAQDPATGHYCRLLVRDGRPGGGVAVWRYRPRRRLFTTPAGRDAGRQRPTVFT